MTKFFIETYGCSHNFADSEQMAGLLKEAKFDPATALEESDIIIFNTCTVKGPTADTFFTRLEKIKKEFPYKIIIIAGCIPQSDPERLKYFSLLGTRQIHHIVEIVEEALNNNIVKMLETGEMPPLDLPKIRKNPLVEIIPINRGCLSSCTFCKTKQARGNLQSYSIDDIFKAADKAVREGVKEIWLTSQDTFCYGFDINSNLPELVKELLEIPGDFRIRIGMGNPAHLKKIIDELIPLLKNEKIFRFLHIPAQSGSDAILKKMARGNTDEEYRSLIRKLKDNFSDLTIATDIIVGFPGETEDDHWKTLNLIRETSPDIVNISRFWPRPKTPAAKMKQLPIETIQLRSRIVSDIFNNVALLQNERWMDWEGEILIDEKGKSENQWVGRNYAYKLVIVEGDYKLGEVLKVKIFKTTIYDLRGKVVSG